MSLKNVSVVFVIFFLFLTILEVSSSVHKIIQAKGGELEISYNELYLRPRIAIVPELNVLIVGIGSNDADYKGLRHPRLNMYSLDSFSLIDTIDIDKDSEFTTDIALRYHPETQLVFVLVHPTVDTQKYRKKMYFFKVTPTKIAFIGESAFGDDMDTNPEKYDCFAQDTLWNGNRAFVLSTGNECCKEITGTLSFNILMYDISIEGYNNASKPYTKRVCSPYHGSRLLLWKNASDANGEVKLLVFGHEKGTLVEFNLDLSTNRTDQIIPTISSPPENLAIGNLVNAEGTNEPIEERYVYLVFSYPSSINYYTLVLYDLEKRENVQTLTVFDLPDNSFSPNFPTMLFIDTNLWIMYIFGIHAISKIRIDPLTKRMDENGFYKQESLRLSHELAIKKNLGTAFFSPPRVTWEKGETEREPNVYTTYGFSRDSSKEVVNTKLQFTIYNISFFACPRGFHIDPSADTRSSVDKGLLYPKIRCIKAAAGHFFKLHDDTSTTYCEPGGFPFLNDMNVTCESCPLGSYSDKVIESEHFCLECPETLNCEKVGDGCSCTWTCDPCAILLADLSVSFELKTEGRFVNVIEYEVAVPHYLEKTSFLVQSGVYELNDTLCGLGVDLALFKTTKRALSNWNTLTKIVNYHLMESRSGISASVMSNRKFSCGSSKDGVLKNPGRLNLGFSMKLNNFEYVIEESMKQSFLNFVGQCFALFSFSVSLGGFIFVFQQKYLDETSLKRLCCACCICCRKQLIDRWRGICPVDDFDDFDMKKKKKNMSQEGTSIEKEEEYCDEQSNNTVHNRKHVVLVEIDDDGGEVFEDILNSSSCSFSSSSSSSD